MEIVLRISNKFSNRSFEMLRSRLFDVIRHEVQHFVDYFRSGTMGKIMKGNQMNIIEKIQSASNYILSDRELVPYIRGMMLSAKKQRRPFRDVVREMIARNFYGGSLEYKNKLKSMAIFKDIENIENITFDKILEEAVKIFPNLKGTK